jgi:acetyl esterase/lipase/outer membrane translocation and assembly module TamA
MGANLQMLVIVALLATAVQAEDAKTIPYAAEQTSFGELQLPTSQAGPFPVAVLIHGGCWRSERGSTASFRALADALVQDGFATWNIEYRRVGHEGGGWPGTFLDLGKAVDLLPKLSREYPLDLGRVVLVGHSSGGYFAAWLASRKRLPDQSEIKGEPAVDFQGVVMADAFIDPLVIDSKGVDGKLYCDDPVLDRLVGGAADARVEQLRQISPMEWLPWGVPQEYVVSSRRYPVTPPRPLADGRTTLVMKDFPALARAAGDRINVDIIDDAGHGDFTKPDTAAFAAVRRAAARLLKREPDAAELERSGAVIGEIFIYNDNIFDLEDPRENKALYRLANKLHIRTRPEVIRQQLLFKSGDPYSQRLLDESARILRSARYLYDASVRPVAVKDGRVDIAVTTRDVWTLNPGLSFSRKGGESTTGFELEELNLFGTGTDLELSRTSGVDRDSTMIEYKDRHVFDSWVRVRAAYADLSDGEYQALEVERPFYALDTRWTAGVFLAEDEHIESLYDLGKVVDEFGIHRKFASATWGWSAGLRDGWVRRWRVGATYDESVFTELVANRKLVYPWLGFELVQNDFDKFRNHDQIGRTEDFHLGTRFSARLGFADRAYGADRSAFIFSAGASHGSGSTDRSALLLNSAVTGRVESGELRDTVLDGSARYYVRQSERRLFFTTLEASVGRQLDVDTQILLGGDNGLRGYPLRYQGGEARALLTVEQRYFTNWYPFRLFRVGAAAFFDIGRTWGESAVSTPSLGLLKDVGIGLRLGNSRSGLGNIIHIDLAFPLDGDSTIDDVQILVETKERF